MNKHDSFVEDYVVQVDPAGKSSRNVILDGGIILSPEQAAFAMKSALRIIECVGTTAVHQAVGPAKAWVKQYFPNWS